MDDARRALITGGAKGIGRALALDLAALGWSIAVCYRTSAKDGDETVAAIQKAGGRGLSVQADTADPQACKSLVEATVRTFGGIDVLIHGAGPYHMTDLFQETPEGWREMFDGNLHSFFYVSRLAAPLMRKQKWGRMIAFGMANADLGTAQPRVTAHYIAKQGVLTLTRTLAKSLAPDGITVNSISPGFIESGSVPLEELKPMIKSIPAGRLGAMADVVSVARFLLSDEAAYVTGANIHVSGGWGI
jgi:3-oxoacyl-[acyl-carrier protein] reductase